MSVNPLKENEQPGTAITSVIINDLQDLKVDETIPEIIEPMPAKKFVQIHPRLNMARTTSGQALKAPDPSIKEQGHKELRRTSDIPIRSKNKQEEGVQTLNEKHSGAKSDRAGRQKVFDQPVRTIVVPLSTFIHALGKEFPVISYKKWDRNVKRLIARQVLDPKFSYEYRKVQLVINDIYDRLLECSSILKRINRARVLLFDIEEHRYLSKFPMNSNPIRFWDSYFTLQKEAPDKCVDFYDIIGKKEAFTILKKAINSGGADMKENIRSQIDLVSYVETKRRDLLKSSFSFSENFDTDNLDIVPTPIYLFTYSEFEESFRAYLTDGPFPEDSIRFNGISLPIPDYKKLGIQNEDREAYFMKWLISELQTRMKISSKSSVEEQIELFTEHWNSGAKDQSFKLAREEAVKLHKAIWTCFADEFKAPCTDKELPDKIDMCFKKMREHDSHPVKFFAEQMVPHLEFTRKYVIANKSFKENLEIIASSIEKTEKTAKEKSEKASKEKRKKAIVRNWEHVAYELVGLRHRFDFLLLKQQKIPLLSMLKSMAYSCSLTGQLFMNRTLCPNLCTKGASPYQLVLDRSHLTSYDILCESSHFEVTHIKTFNIVLDDKVKANVQIHWTPNGKLDSTKYSSSQVFTQFDYLPDCPYEERKIIADQFDLEFKDSPWGKYLKREDINDIFKADPPKLSLLDMVST